MTCTCYTCNNRADKATARASCERIASVYNLAFAWDSVWQEYRVGLKTDKPAQRYHTDCVGDALATLSRLADSTLDAALSGAFVAIAEGRV